MKLALDLNKQRSKEVSIKSHKNTNRISYILGNESISSDDEEGDSRVEARTRMKYNLQDFTDTQITSTSITDGHHRVPKTKHKSGGSSSIENLKAANEQVLFLFKHRRHL